MDNHLHLRVPKRLIKALLVLTVAAAVITPIAVSASHQFTDVPDTNIFHENIAWLADNDVTKGCNPPTNDMFCPGDNVTREQMAAFMQRLAEGKVVDAATAVTADSAEDANTVDGKDSSLFYTYGSKAPAFTTQTGVFGLGVAATAAGELAETDISFTIPMAGDLLGHVIDVGDPVPTGCSGSVTAPAADPGHLCIFAGYNSTGAVIQFYRPDTGVNDGTVTPYGAVVGFLTTGAFNYELAGTWAATSPLSIIVIPADEGATQGIGN